MLIELVIFDKYLYAYQNKASKYEKYKPMPSKDIFLTEVLLEVVAKLHVASTW